MSFESAGTAFLLPAAAAGLFAGAAAAKTFAGDPRRSRIYAAIAGSCAGSFGLILARDVFVFWACSVLASLSIWPLIAYRGGDAARRAGRIYVAFAIAAEALLGAGVLIAVGAAGTTDLAELPARAVMDRSILVATTLILVGGAIKAGAVPLHAWVPGSFSAAPLPAAVVMAGATTRTGVLAMMRLLPLGLVALDRWGVPVVLLGVLGTFYGAVAAVRERDPRIAIAYIGVSQTGLVVAGIGMGLVTAAGWPALQPAVLALAAHSSLAVLALFLALDAVRAPGITRAARGAVLGVMAVLALSLAGFPPTPGAGAMALLTDAFGRSGLPAARGIVSMLLLAATGTTLAAARVVWLASRTSMIPGGAEADPEHTRRPAAIATAVAAAGVALLSPVMLMRSQAAAGSLVWMETVPYVAAGAALAGLAVWRGAVRR